jgi:hypothetical protein
MFDIGSWIGMYTFFSDNSSKLYIVLGINADNIVRIKDNNVSSDEGFDRIIKLVNIGASNKKTLAVLDKRESRMTDWVSALDMPEGKTNGQDAIQ